jgi:short-subunit dehydrogenase
LLYLTQAMNEEIGVAGVTLQAVLPGATRTEIWERSGRNVEDLDPNRTMDVDELVDAALAGLDKGELVTIPSGLDPKGACPARPKPRQKRRLAARKPCGQRSIVPATPMMRDASQARPT